MMIILRFLAYGVIGFVLEWLAGQVIHRVTGKYLWVYPGSRLKTGSPWMVPLWGTIGIIFEGVGKVVGG